MKKGLSIILCFVMVMSLFSIVPFTASAEEAVVSDTGTEADLSDVSAVEDIAEEAVDIDDISDEGFESTGNATFDAFISDYRWKHGATYASRGPYIANFDGSGCAAYCADFVKYCYGADNPGGAPGRYFNNSSEIQAGDVIIVNNRNTHWFVVLKRNGNSLYTAEGNIATYADAQMTQYLGTFVRVGWNYTFSGNSLYGTYTGTLAEGYHFGSAPHTHNYSTYVYNSSSHPHYGCYQCSCGEVQENTSQPHYSSSCSSCNHTVSFDANGGSGAPGSQTKKYLSTLYLSSTVPTRTDYKFLGWSTDRYATSAQYQPGAAYDSDANITLYAIWKLLGYTIKFDPNGGEYNEAERYCEPDDIQVEVGSSARLPYSDYQPYKAGHRFLGWSLTPNHDDENCFGSGEYLSGEIIQQAADANRVVTLYATWEAPTVVYLNQQVTNDGKWKYVFTPNASGYYLIKGECVWYGDGLTYEYNGITGKTTKDSWNGETFSILLKMESNKPCYLTFSGGSNFVIQSCNIASMKAIAGVKRYVGYRHYYDTPNLDYEEFNPIIQLYDNNGQQLFSGSVSALSNQLGLSITSNTVTSDTAGTKYMTISLGDISCQMSVTFLENPISSISAHFEGNLILDGVNPHYYKEEVYDGLVMTVYYKDGTQKTVYGKDFYTNGKFDGRLFNGECVFLSGHTLQLGNNNIQLTYLGVTTSFNVVAQENPIQRISVITAPSLYEDECVTYRCGENAQPQVNASDLLHAYPIKLKIVYKDNTSKYLTINDSQVSSIAKEQLNDSFHEVTMDIEYSNYRPIQFKITYLNTTVDVDVDYMESDNRNDKITNFEIISLPDDSFFSLVGTKVRIYHESGKIVEGIYDPPYWQEYSGVIVAGKNSYQIRLTYSDDTMYMQIGGVTKPISISKIESATIIGPIQNSRVLEGILLKCKLDNGTTVYYNYTQYKQTDEWYAIYRLERNIIEEEENYYLCGNYRGIINYNDIERIPVEYEMEERERAMDLAYIIATSTDLYNYSSNSRSKDDIDQLIQTLPALLKNAYYNDKMIPFEESYTILNQYYGLTLNEMISSKYYVNEAYLVCFPAEGLYMPYHYTTDIKLYEVTSDSYIFKYCDGNKTRYIEVSKGMKLLSVSDIAPDIILEYSVTMTDGYSSHDTAFVGNTVTICTNVPEGKEFVNWTSNNASVQFADETAQQTTFTMIDDDVEITPVFRDIVSEDPIILGDADGDGTVGSIDVTQIMRVCAQIDTGIDEDVLMNADVDGNGVLEIIDATYIQRYLANMQTPYEYSGVVEHLRRLKLNSVVGVN